MKNQLGYTGLLAGVLLGGMLLAPTPARAEAIKVVPMSIYYGDVDLGTPPRFEKVSITDELGGLDIWGMEIVSDDPNSPFAIATPMFFPIDFEVGESIEVTIAFRPLSEGPHDAVLRIVSNAITDPDLGSGPVVDVQLRGHGGPSVTPADLMADILEFFDLAVATDMIVDQSSDPRIANLQIRAMRKLLQASSDVLDAGYPQRSAFLLQRALLRLDGQPSPNDYISGDQLVLNELGAMILELLLVLEDV